MSSLGKTGSTRAWREIRAAVLAAEPLCHWRYPGCTTYSTDADHVTPRAKGGSDAPTNLVGACRSCNLRRAAEQARTRSAAPPSRPW